MTDTRRLVVHWIVGALAGTVIIAITSPLFVRSYLPRELNRDVRTLPANSTYRWRSEGYADTQIGPLGMPGKTSIRARSDDVTRVALWGDSQSEGVCVCDEHKIFAWADRLGGGRCEVFPFARSGDNAADWLAQLPLVEERLSIDLHVFQIVELSDLQAASDGPRRVVSNDEAIDQIAKWLPAFIIQAVRNLATDADRTTHRTLRFSLGPVSAPGHPPPSDFEHHFDWSASFRAIATATNRPVLILYAPRVPQIMDGKVEFDDPEADEFVAMRESARSAGFFVADASESLRKSARLRAWPHGFHNGRIGSGHLNEIGNRIVASYLITAAIQTAKGN